MVLGHPVYCVWYCGAPNLLMNPLMDSSPRIKHNKTTGGGRRRSCHTTYTTTTTTTTTTTIAHTVPTFCVCLFFCRIAARILRSAKT